MNWAEKIVSYGYDGEGVTRHEGKVCFVPFALKDELVEVAPVQEKSSFVKCKVVKILSSSPLREAPPCPYFGKCGGCAYQHTTYQNELEIKKSLLVSHLKKIGYSGEIQVISSENEYGYRNKIKLFVDGEKIGFKEKNSSRVCDVDKCLIADDRINYALENVKTFIKTQDLFKDYSEITIRVENKKGMIIFKRNSEKKINYQGLYLMMSGDFGIFELSKRGLYHKVGEKMLKTNEFGLDCSFYPNSFHQVNKFVYPHLYQSALDAIKGNVVVNCYSGNGVLSGIIAQKFDRVYGIELGVSEHNEAQELRENNSLYNLVNIHGDCEVKLKEICEIADTVVLDPPRSGISEKIASSLNNLLFKRLVYISCDSATCIRDLARIKNLKIKKVLLYDMFARTSEFEIMVVADKI